MNKKFLADIRILKKAIDSKKLVVFTGAGIDVDSGVPLWSTLVNELSQDIEIPTNESDSLKIAQMYYNEREQKEYIDKVREILKHKRVRYNPIHEIIFDLKPEHILTTNYGDLFEQVINKKALPFSVVSKDEHFPFSLNTNLLVKIHGDLNDVDIVLKEDDYLDYSLNHPLIEGFIKSVFASKVVLFLGYSFSDIDLKYILQNVRSILGENFQNAYLITTDKMHPTQRDYLKHKGINVVSFWDAEFKKNGITNNFITDYLNGSNSLNKNYYRNDTGLSERGQMLYDILLFISVYGVFNEKIKDNSPIEQLYNSLKRFDGVRTIPSDFIANLYPIKNTVSYLHNINGFWLRIDNPNIANLFYNEVSFKGGKAILKPEVNCSESKRKIDNIMLSEIQDILNFSMIHFLGKNEDKPDSFGNYGWDEKYIDIRKNQDKPCQCLNCKYSRFEFKSVIEEAFDSVISDTSDLKGDLILAYSNYKLGNFLNSYYSYEQIANKAWLTGQYIIYFISKLSIKYLRNLIKYEINDSNKEVRDRIVESIDKLDIDKLLIQITELDEDQFNLLKDIKNEAFFEKCVKSIDKTINEITKVYDTYNKGTGKILGPNYPIQLQQELAKLFSFLTNNCIPLDEYTNFKDVAKRAIDSLIMSYATNEAYSEKLQEFDSFTLNIIVFYCNERELSKTFNSYKIYEIKVNDENLKEFLSKVSNFLSSNHNVNNFFGEHIFDNKQVNSQLNNNFFGDKFRRIFGNIFLILSKIKLDKNKADNLIQKLLDFLSSEKFLNWGEIEMLSYFIFKNYHLFKEKDVDRLMKISINQSKYYLRGNFIESIENIALQSIKGYKIKEPIIINRLIDYFEGSGTSDYKYLSPLWSIVDEEYKKVLQEKIIMLLNNKFNENLYTSASRRDIIDFNDFFDQYISYVDNYKGVEKFEKRNGRILMDNVTFYNFIVFVHYVKIEKRDKLLKKFNKKTDFMNFILNPDSFNYKKFNSDWLLIWDIPVFITPFETAKIEIRTILKKELRENYNSLLAEVYFKYFVD